MVLAIGRCICLIPNWGGIASAPDVTSALEFAGDEAWTVEINGHVYLIDDDGDIRTHVGALLRLLGYDVRTFAEAAAFVEQSSLDYPAVVILDMCMPGMSGLQVQKKLLEAGSLATIVYLSGNSERQDIIDAMKAGAADFLWKPVSRQTLAAAVADAMVKSRAACARVAHQLRLRDGLEQLSNREREVYEMMINGLQNRQIASRLDVRADTIKKHRTVICEKFMVQDTVELIALSRCLEPDWVEPT